MELKIEHIVENLESIKKENMDLYDVAAIIILELHDMMQAKSPRSFLKEKRDLKKQLKVFKRLINNKTFRN